VTEFHPIQKYNKASASFFFPHSADPPPVAVCYVVQDENSFWLTSRPSFVSLQEITLDCFSPIQKRRPSPPLFSFYHPPVVGCDFFCSFRIFCGPLLFSSPAKALFRRPAQTCFFAFSFRRPVVPFLFLNNHFFLFLSH